MVRENDMTLSGEHTMQYTIKYHINKKNKIFISISESHNFKKNHNSVKT